MTEMLHFPSVDACYLREFDGKVLKAKDDWVVLDRTCFYPEGGGQPADQGVLTWPGAEARVKDVSKKGVVKHVLEGAAKLPEPGTTVHGLLDWTRRYAHMRMHTSQHVVSGVAYRLFRATTAGNQLYADRARVDLAPIRFDDEKIRLLEEGSNRAFATKADVRIIEMPRAELREKVEDRSLLDLIPQTVQVLRVVGIGADIDLCPCAGTHVRNLAELGRIKIVGRESKGKDTDRIEYVLDPAPAVS